MPSGPTNRVAHLPGPMQFTAAFVLASVSQCHCGRPIRAAPPIRPPQSARGSWGVRTPTFSAWLSRDTRSSSRASRLSDVLQYGSLTAAAAVQP